MGSFILPIISGLAGLFGGQPKQQTSTTNSSSNSTGNFNSLNAPQLNSNQNDLMNSFTNDAINRDNKPIDLSGFTAGGLQTINDGADLKSKIISNSLASKGLSFSPAAAFSQVQPQSDRIDQSTQFLNTVPLIQKQLQDQNFQNLLSAFKTIPTATETNGASASNTTGSQTTTGTSPNNSIAGALGGLGAGLAGPSGGYDAKGQPVGGNNMTAILKALGIG